MIGAARMWARRMWAARYWPKVGADPSGFNPAWASNSNLVMGSGNTVLGQEEA